MKIKGLKVITIICILLIVIINFTNYKLPELIEGEIKIVEVE